MRMSMNRFSNVLPSAIRTTVLGAALTAALAGCPNREVSEVNPAQDKEEFKDIPLTINRDIDILFVIDNSGSMLEEQASLAANFPQFINVLDNIEGGLPNVHIGVVSSDMGTLNVPTGDGACAGLGDNGALQARATCNVNGLFINDVDNGGGGRTTNYGAQTLAQAFSCTAALGTGGCGFEQHLESMRAALTNTTANNGFLRPSAFLAVIFVADEDDCSAKNGGFFGPDSAALGPLDSFRCFEFGVECDGASDPRAVGPRTNCQPIASSQYMYQQSEIDDRYVNFLKGLKSDEKDVIVAGIIGNVEPVEIGRRTPASGGDPRPDLVPSCTYAGPNGMQTADAGVRLKYFLDQFPNRSTITTICDNDLSDALVQIADLLATVIGNPCIEGNLADRDPGTNGVQPECQASYVTNPGEENQVEDVLAQCNDTASNQPCWRLIQDPNCTDYPTGLSIEVVRSVEPPPDTHIFARCVTE